MLPSLALPSHVSACSSRPATAASPSERCATCPVPGGWKTRLGPRPTSASRSMALAARATSARPPRPATQTHPCPSTFVSFRLHLRRKTMCGSQRTYRTVLQCGTLGEEPGLACVGLSQQVGTPPLPLPSLLPLSSRCLLLPCTYLIRSATIIHRQAPPAVSVPHLCLAHGVAVSWPLELVVYVQWGGAVLG